MTKKIFDEDSHICEFEALVKSCEKADKRYRIILDKTAFFFEGGGQSHDKGTLGGIEVVDVQEEGEEIIHYTLAPIEVGSKVMGKIDPDNRLRCIQHHSGEHILSGLIHEKFGYDNIGFHLGEQVTMDFNGSFTRKDLDEIEDLANKIIAENIKVNIKYPSPEELKSLSYRSKLDLEENVRIVEFEGYDVCACCAPHVNYSGEIGLVKIVSFEKYKGGTRLYILAGLDALKDYRNLQKNNNEIVALLSAKTDETASAVKKLKDDYDILKAQKDELFEELIDYKIKAIEDGRKNIVFMEPHFNNIALRKLINEAMKKVSGIAAGFIGDDINGYNYILGSENVDLKEKAKEINESLKGRGGGSKTMISGSVKASKDEIIKYFAD